MSPRKKSGSPRRRKRSRAKSQRSNRSWRTPISRKKFRPPFWLNTSSAWWNGKPSSRTRRPRSTRWVEFSQYLLLHRHDELVHDVIFPLRRVLAHVEIKDRAGL